MLNRLTKDEFGDWCEKNIGTDYAFEAAWQTYEAFFGGVDDSLGLLENIARLELARAELDVKIAYLKMQAMLEAVSSPIAARIIMQLRHPIDTDGAENSLQVLSRALAHGLIGYDQFNELLESFPALIYGVAKIEAVTVGQLRIYAIEGRLTTKFIIDVLERLSKT